MADRTVLVIPTAINVVTLVADTLTAAIRDGLVASVTLPSLYRRAKLVVNESDVVPVVVVSLGNNLVNR